MESILREWSFVRKWLSGSERQKTDRQRKGCMEKAEAGTERQGRKSQGLLEELGEGTTHLSPSGSSSVARWVQTQ